MHNTRYFWTKEPHLGGGPKDGELHMHMGVDVYIPQRILKYAWELATDGDGKIVYVNENKNAEIRNMGAYMAKYITKTLGNYYEGFEKRERRYQFSMAPEFKKQKYIPKYQAKYEIDMAKYLETLRKIAMPRAKQLWRDLRAGADPPGSTA